MSSKKTDLQVYDIVCNDIATRMVHGMQIQHNHTCIKHPAPVSEVIYILSSTTNHSWSNAEWCAKNMVYNGYRKMTAKDKEKDFIKYTPYKNAKL